MVKQVVVKTGGVVLKKAGGVSFIFILTNPFQCYLSLSFWCVCMCVCMYVCGLFVYTTSVLTVFHRKNLVLQHLINRYMTSTMNNFWKDIVESKFLISENYSECACVCVVCVMWYQIRVPVKNHITCQT